MRTVHARQKPTADLDVVADQVLSSAAGAVSVAGEQIVRSLLDLPDAKLGHLFKARIEYILKALAGNDAFATPSPASARPRQFAREVALPRPQRTHEREGGALDLVALDKQALSTRKTLVDQKHLLDSAQMCAGLDISRQALNKAMASGRMFSVDVGGAAYYPAFFASGKIDRKTLEKTAKQLGALPGWSKWHFFTTALDPLDGLTPLQALEKGRLADVLAAADAFVHE